MRVRKRLRRHAHRIQRGDMPAIVGKVYTTPEGMRYRLIRIPNVSVLPPYSVLVEPL